MLTIRRSGIDLNTLAAQIGNVPKTMIPYAAATALTRCAKHAQTKALPDAMRASFDGVTSWTLNSLRIEPATKDHLSARIMVKNQASGVPPENYLFPEVEGGERKRKRSENAMGYAGVLASGEYAMPKAMELDANGNVKGAEVRTILAALKNIRGGVGAKGQRAGRGKRLANDLFVGKPRGGDRPGGIWRREGHRLRALFVFTSRAPVYKERLDFNGVVQQVALDRFKPEFEKAVAALQARGWK